MGDTSNLVMSWRTVMMVMVCLPIVISAILLLFKRYEPSASRFLATLLLLCVLAMGPQIIGFAGFYDVWPGLTFFPFTIDLWIGPLFYLHAQRLIEGGPLGWRKWLLLPGIIETVYYCWAFLSLGDYQQKWAYSKAFHSPYIIPVESALAVLFMILAIYSVWQMSKAYKHYLQNTQSAAIEFEPVWLDRMIIALVISGVIFGALEIVPMFTDVSYFEAFPFQVLLMLTIAWLSIEAVWRLNQEFPKLTLSSQANPESLTVHVVPKNRSKDNPDGNSNVQKDELATEAKGVDGECLNKVDSLNQEETAERDWRAEGANIEEAVLTNQWFLEPRFSLRELAKRVGSNEAYVSKSINQGLSQSFNEFINQLRVEHAKKLIGSTDQPLLTIALDSGFNSKATFNRVFRDFSKMTPSQFKKQA